VIFEQTLVSMDGEVVTTQCYQPAKKIFRADVAAGSKKLKSEFRLFQWVSNAGDTLRF